MLAVGVLGGTEADDELVRLWKYATRACDREWARLEQESADRQQAARNPVRTTRRGGMNAGNLLSRNLNALESLKEKVAETWLEYALKLHEYGFRIEDPDIQSLRERR